MCVNALAAGGTSIVRRVSERLVRDVPKLFRRFLTRFFRRLLGFLLVHYFEIVFNFARDSYKLN